MLRITLETLSADKRRRRREVVESFTVSDHKDVSEFEAVAELQDARSELDDAALELIQVQRHHELCTDRLRVARLDVRRVSER